MTHITVSAKQMEESNVCSDAAHPLFYTPHWTPCSIWTPSMRQLHSWALIHAARTSSSPIFKRWECLPPPLGTRGYPSRWQWRCCRIGVTGSIPEAAFLRARERPCVSSSHLRSSPIARGKCTYSTHARGGNRMSSWDSKRRLLSACRIPPRNCRRNSSWTWLPSSEPNRPSLLWLSHPRPQRSWSARG